jgi:ADP-ribose pyrophosphatase YjhB (NUDIX family)
MNDSWCNNCGKSGHQFNQCKIPITSFGCIVFRINKTTKKREYLMICRRYSIAYLEFIRGKYNVSDKENIKYILQQMTNDERTLIKCGDFNNIWNITWNYCNKSIKFNNEEQISNEKYNLLCNENLMELIDDCLNDTPLIDKTELFPKNGWNEPEWGFPKGRREYKETDYNCAIREFKEETGINTVLLQQIKNIIPIEENFIGTNYKKYKHKYYLMYMNYADTLIETNFQKSEVSCISWKSIEECIHCIRPYNIEKKNIIKNIDEALEQYIIV